jgi:transcription initiation factor TFIIB
VQLAHERYAEAEAAALEAAGDAEAPQQEGRQPQDQRCPHCPEGAGRPTVESGNVVCATCRTVVDRFLDHGADWRAFPGDDGRAVDTGRCCPAASELLPTLGCVVARSRRSHRNSLPWAAAPAHQQMQPPADAVAGAGPRASTCPHNMIANYQAWSALTYRERHLCRVFDAIALHAARDRIPACIVEQAKALYKRASEVRAARGPNRQAMVACAMYLACKSSGVPRSLKEVAAMFDVQLTVMTRACKDIQDAVHLDVESSAPEDYVGRFCSKLDMAPEATLLVRGAVQRAEQLGVACESAPTSVVAGAILLVSGRLGLGLERRAIGEACHTAPVTIGKYHKRLAAYAEQLLRQPPPAGA